MQKFTLSSSTGRQCTLRGCAGDCKARHAIGTCSTHKIRRGSSIATRVSSESVDRINDNGATNGFSGSAGALDFEELTDIIRLVHDTDIVEFELKSKKFSLAVRKKEALEQPEPVVQRVYQPPAEAAAAPPFAAPAPAPVAAANGPSAAPAAPAAAAPAPTPAAAPAPVVDGLELTSPMAGTFYIRPAPGEPEFVKEGDVVTKGQTVGIVEAMKLMNNIEADVNGIITKLLVKNGDPVVPGQALMVVKPQ